MAFSIPTGPDTAGSDEPVELGIDLMKVEIPQGETTKTFADVLRDQVRTLKAYDR